LCNGAQMAIFCVIFASCIFSEPCAAHFRHVFYTVSHKKTEPTYFCLLLREKSTDFNAVSTVRINDERHMWRHELHPPHLISVATLPCESQNSKNVILQCNITKEIASNISYMLHRNGPLNYKSWGVMQQCVYETKICDIYDLQNAWRKLGLTSNRRLKWLLDNSRTCQLADCQLADETTSILDKSRTGQLADATGNFACFFVLLAASARPRVAQSATCPVRELAIRELVYPRVVQLPDGYFVVSVTMGDHNKKNETHQHEIANVNYFMTTMYTISVK